MKFLCIICSYREDVTWKYMIKTYRGSVIIFGFVIFKLEKVLLVLELWI